MKKKQLTSRDEQILLRLKELDFLTRDQLNKLFKLGKVRNTNRVLFNLSDYLMTIKEGHQSVYYLSKLGREYVDCDKVRKKTNNVHHTIMRNQFWLFYKCPKDWQSEMKVMLDKNYIVVDAMFTRNNFKHFLEVDNLQSMKANREKIKCYKEIIDTFVTQFGYYPTLVWVTTTEHRRRQLEMACVGLKVKVYTMDDIK
ncbi:replication-relaxation family protein [Bacillus sp. FJAT-22090]|uniref:replication-relaxation family protein n=1 Tax=Bacillus sp. FJAT-22090 TaxID=1581038 RepID=UPI0011A8BCC9|nr:replication-relaxation family protein [Bacillus sp. FJAT-22090]